ncbi:MAG: nuclear transport factor 2 family protein [Candidatus Acidiferrales bacterium]
MRKAFTRGTACAILLAGLALVGYETYYVAPAKAQSPTAGTSAAVDTGVRDFMRHVAHDVTQDGPSAWRKYFAETPAFFMVVDGQMAFANSADATAGIQQVAKSIKQIDLKWGDLRVDPLSLGIVVVAAPYHELQVWADGHRAEESGYFTGVVESRDGRWQIRNCHWSEPVPPPSVR